MRKKSVHLNFDWKELTDSMIHCTKGGRQTPHNTHDISEHIISVDRIKIYMSGLELSVSWGDLILRLWWITLMLPLGLPIDVCHELPPSQVWCIDYPLDVCGWRVKDSCGYIYNTLMICFRKINNKIFYLVLNLHSLHFKENGENTLKTTSWSLAAAQPTGYGIGHLTVNINH